MPFTIIRNDITKIKADAIVNTANTKPKYATGTDHAIYTAAGPHTILAERLKIGVIERGDIAVTSAGNLDAKYIIHAVGPIWEGGNSGEFDLLESCYRKSLEKAYELGCESIAFPLISTGVFGFPKDKALTIAINCFSSFLMEHDMDITLVVFDTKAFELSNKLVSNVQAFIDENYVKDMHADEYGVPFTFIPEHTKKDGEDFLESAKFLFAGKNNHYIQSGAEQGKEPVKVISLEERLSSKEETYQEMVFRLIDERGIKKDSDVYKKANMSKNIFSKIRSGKSYKPKKKNLVGLAFALELDVDTTQELLGKAEFALSRSSRFDTIVMYFLEKKEYDVNTVNAVLFEYGEELIG